MSEDFHFEIAQDQQEIQEFVTLLKAEGVTSYLEIGSKFGGSLWRVGRNLPKGSRIVSVDMPNGTRLWKDSQASLKYCAEKLRELGQDVTIIWGNSQVPEVVEQVRKHAPFDCVLIDADHRLPGLTLDWENYGPLSNLIAFHDISWRRPPDWNGVRIDVPEFWNAIKGDYRHEEFRYDHALKDNGIGVLWRDLPNPLGSQ